MWHAMTDAERKARMITFLQSCLREFTREPLYFAHLVTAARDQLNALEHPERATPSFRDQWGDHLHGGCAASLEP